MKRILFLILTVSFVIPVTFAESNPQKIIFSIQIPMDNKGDNEDFHCVIVYSVFETGNAFSARSVYNWAGQASRRKELTKEELEKLNGLIKNLPRQTSDKPKEQLVFVRIATPEGDVKNKYERTKLPKVMKEIFDLLGGIREELEGKIAFVQ